MSEKPAACTSTSDSALTTAHAAPHPPSTPTMLEENGYAGVPSAASTAPPNAVSSAGTSPEAVSLSAMVVG